MTDLSQILGNHPLVTGGAALAVGGYLFALARSLPGRVFGYARARLITSVEISDNDPGFGWLERWLAMNPSAYRSRNFALKTVEVQTTGPPQTVVAASTQSGMTTRHVLVNTRTHATPNRLFGLSPAPGNHFVRFRGRRIWLERRRHQLEQGGKPFQETFVLTFLGSSGLLDDLMLEAFKLCTSGDPGIQLFIASGGGGWSHAGYRPRRPLESIALPSDQVQDLVEDLTEFARSEKWYIDRGVPYQRGYLFHGPPGTGKTSLVTALAGKIGYSVRIISLTSPDIHDVGLVTLLAQPAERSIFLIEDVDAVFKGRNSKDGSRLSFSGVLNALDGIISPAGRVLIMTTNHPERLDPALIRPGRVDRRVEFSYATPDQAARMFAWFYRGHDCDLEELGEEFALKFKGLRDVSPATIQEHLLRHRASPRDAVRATLLTLIAA